MQLDAKFSKLVRYSGAVLIDLLEREITIPGCYADFVWILMRSLRYHLVHTEVVSRRDFVIP